MAVDELAVVAASVLTKWLTTPDLHFHMLNILLCRSVLSLLVGRQGRLSRYEGTPRPRRRRASKYDRSFDFTRDLRVSRIVFAPASIRVLAERSRRRHDPRCSRRKPNCLTLLDYFSIGISPYWRRRVAWLAGVIMWRKLVFTLWSRRVKQAAPWQCNTIVILHNSATLTSGEASHVVHMRPHCVNVLCIAADTGACNGCSVCPSKRPWIKK